MNDAVKAMLQQYACRSTQDYVNALKEIIQEIALLGLWRAKFYEHAAFYGGTALRILHGLARFSEDLDFSLLQPNPKFSLKKYNQAIKDELQAFGFVVEVESKQKSQESQIQSAFIKAGTYQQLIQIETPAQLLKSMHQHKMIRIKMEVDTDPPQHFTTEAKYRLLPIPFSILTFSLSDLFAGKLHAVLCRQWQSRVKGRDWYDLVWYLSHKTPVHLAHLQARLQQSGHWPSDKTLTLVDVKKRLRQRIEKLDVAAAKTDISLFIRDQSAIQVWSADFFNAIIDDLIGC
jgi:hypothetical protein